MQLDNLVKEFLDKKRNEVTLRTLKNYTRVINKYCDYVEQDITLMNLSTASSFSKLNPFNKKVLTAFLKHANIDSNMKKFVITNKYILKYRDNIEELSEITIKNYTYIVSVFFRTIKKDSPYECTVDDLKQFLKNAPIDTKATRLAATKNFFKFYNIDTFENMHINKKERKNKQLKNIKNSHLTETELEKLTKWLTSATTNREELKDKALIYTSLSCGTRIDELTKILVKDVGEREMLTHGKGGKDRYVVMHDDYIDFINSYITEMSLSNDSNLFPTKYGKPFSPNGLSNRLRDRFSNEPLNLREETNVTMHKLRHTYATILNDQGVPLSYIQYQLGHEDISTTQLYLGAFAKAKTDKLKKNYSNIKISVN